MTSEQERKTSLDVALESAGAHPVARETLRKALADINDSVQPPSKDNRPASPKETEDKKPKK